MWFIPFAALVFLAVNWSMFADALSWSDIWMMELGGLRFDTSAILYTNALYALLMLFPIHYKESRIYQKIAKCIFVAVNAVCVVANMVDRVHVPIYHSPYNYDRIF